MKKNELINKTLAGLMIAAMTAGVCPTTAFAVTGAQVAKDGTYTKEVTVEGADKILDYYRASKGAFLCIQKNKRILHYGYIIKQSL